jgi:hypothetical protein
MANTNEKTRHKTGPHQRNHNIADDCLSHLHQRGYCAVRTTGNRAPFDIVLWGQNTIQLIQVRRVKDITLVTQTIEAAKQDWESYWKPRMEGVRRELWLRYNHEWHIADLDVSQ